MPPWRTISIIQRADRERLLGRIRPAALRAPFRVVMWFADALALIGAMVAPSVVFLTPIVVVGDYRTAPWLWWTMTVVCVAVPFFFLLAFMLATIGFLRARELHLPCIMSLMGNGIALAGIALMLLA